MFVRNQRSRIKSENAPFSENCCYYDVIVIKLFCDWREHYECTVIR